MIFRELHIYDASSVIYAGTLSKYKSDYLASKDKGKLKGLMVGGIRKLLNEVLLEKVSSDVIVAMDSPINKSQFDPNYKSNRNKNPEILLQQIMLQEILADLKIPFIKMNNLEADDIVAALTDRHFQERQNIIIHSGDSDLAANLKRPTYRLIGPASRFPSIDANNYSSILTKDTYIPYNAILPYYFFFGKTSNNVKRAPFVESAESEFSRFLTMCKDMKLACYSWSDASAIASWYAECADKSRLSLKDFFARLSVVYPAEIENLPEIDFTVPVDKNKLNFYATLLGLSNAAALYGVKIDINSDYTPDMWNFIMKYKNMDQDGSLAIDLDSTPDMSFFLEVEKELETTFKNDDSQALEESTDSVQAASERSDLFLNV